MNISEALRRGSAILLENEIPNAFRESASLLCFVLDKDRTFLIAHSEYDLSAEQEASYLAILHRRAGREPFQYIVEKQEFYGLEFYVSKDVLIPRPETEILVAESIARLQKRGPLQLLEIGTGSGCITISVLDNVRTARAIATDVSAAAIKIASQNAAKHGIEARVEFRTGSLYSPVPNMLFDAILSNPPYVPVRDIPDLQPEVRDHEPYIALTDGGSGLLLIEQIIADAPKHLREEGFLALEIGFMQFQTVKAIFDPSIWANIEVFPDMRGIERVVIAHLS